MPTPDDSPLLTGHGPDLEDLKKINVQLGKLCNPSDNNHLIDPNYILHHNINTFLAGGETSNQTAIQAFIEKAEAALNKNKEENSGGGTCCSFPCIMFIIIFSAIIYKMISNDLSTTSLPTPDNSTSYGPR